MGLAAVTVLLLTCVLCIAALTLPSHTPHKKEHSSGSSVSNLRLNFMAKKPVYTTFTPIGEYIGAGNWTFGPVFTNNVLHEVSHMRHSQV